MSRIFHIFVYQFGHSLTCYGNLNILPKLLPLTYDIEGKYIYKDLVWTTSLVIVMKGTKL